MLVCSCCTFLLLCNCPLVIPHELIVLYELIAPHELIALYEFFVLCAAEGRVVVIAGASCHV